MTANTQEQAHEAKVVLIALLVLFTVFIVASLASLDWEKEVEIGFHSDVAKDNHHAQRLLKANGIS